MVMKICSGHEKMSEEHRRDESTRGQEKGNEPVSMSEFFEKIPPGVRACEGISSGSSSGEKVRRFRD
jgi:hypothetical protein